MHRKARRMLEETSTFLGLWRSRSSSCCLGISISSSVQQLRPSSYSRLHAFMRFIRDTLTQAMYVKDSCVNIKQRECRFCLNGMGATSTFGVNSLGSCLVWKIDCVMYTKISRVKLRHAEDFALEVANVYVSISADLAS